MWGRARYWLDPVRCTAGISVYCQSKWLTGTTRLHLILSGLLLKHTMTSAPLKILNDMLLPPDPTSFWTQCLKGVAKLSIWANQTRTSAQSWTRFRQVSSIHTKIWVYSIRFRLPLTNTTHPISSACIRVLLWNLVKNSHTLYHCFNYLQNHHLQDMN